MSGKYIDKLLEKVMIRASVTESDISIDTESYSEMEALSSEIDVSGLKEV